MINRMKLGRWLILALIVGLLVEIWAVNRSSTKQPSEIEEGKTPSTFLSPTECVGADGQPAHGTYRWAVKVDEEQPSLDNFGEILVSGSYTVGDLSKWPDLEVASNSPRQDGELSFIELTGKVVLVRCEDDGDLHVQLKNSTSYVQAVVEVPLGKPWDSIRQEVFGWANVTFPCKPHQLELTKHPVIRVTGKAFYDGIHKGKIPNRRSYDENVTVWEIHPVMKLEVIKP